MKFSESVKPISYLKQNTAEAIKIVHTNHSPMIITQNGEAKAVLLDVAEYEQDQESLAMLKMIAQSKESYSVGKFKTARKAFSDIRKNIKDAQV
jgi:prevent-host-death family protein